MSRADSIAVRAAALLLAASCSLAAQATDFSVTPIRAELKAGMMSETVTVANLADKRLRVSVKLVEWTQDADGKDVYKDSADLVYFPRQLEIEAGGKRLVRVGAKSPTQNMERTYRLFIEEEPEANAEAGKAQVSFYFRFGLPVFLPPAVGRAQPEIGQLAYDHGKLAVDVRNLGNQHFRLTRVVFAGAGFSKEVAGWYSLAGTQRSYAADLPRDACRKGGKFTVLLEGDGVRIERALDVDPAACV